MMKMMYRSKNIQKLALSTTSFLSALAFASTAIVTSFTMYNNLPDASIVILVLAALTLFMLSTFQWFSVKDRYAKMFRRKKVSGKKTPSFFSMETITGMVDILNIKYENGDSLSILDPKQLGNAFKIGEEIEVDCYYKNDGDKFPVALTVIKNKPLDKLVRRLRKCSKNAKIANTKNCYL